MIHLMVSVPSIDVGFMNCSRSVFPCAGSTTPSLFEHEGVAVKSSTTVYCVRATFGEKYLHTIYIPLPIDRVGLCTPFCSIKWVPTTKWVRTPQLLVSTKWVHTPSGVLMLNVLLERACKPFCRKNISLPS